MSKNRKNRESEEKMQDEKTPKPERDEAATPSREADVDEKDGLDEAVEGIAGAVAEQTALAKELEAASERALRLQAELDNVRKRAQRQIEEERLYACMPLIRDLLPVLDNMDRAVEAAEQKHDVESLLAGVKIVASQFIEALGKHDCQPIPALHEHFDPHLHHAISQMPSEEHSPGTITHVAQAGFQLHDRVVRPSQVIIAAGEAEEKAEG